MMAEAGNLGFMLVNFLRRMRSDEKTCNKVQVWPYLESHVITAEVSFATALQTDWYSRALGGEELESISFPDGKEGCCRWNTYAKAITGQRRTEFIPSRFMHDAHLMFWRLPFPIMSRSLWSFMGHSYQLARENRFSEIPWSRSETKLAARVEIYAKLTSVLVNNKHPPDDTYHVELNEWAYGINEDVDVIIGWLTIQQVAIIPSPGHRHEVTLVWPPKEFEE
jgi:hypothetical protein